MENEKLFNVIREELKVFFSRITEQEIKVIITFLKRHKYFQINYNERMSLRLNVSMYHDY